MLALAQIRKELFAEKTRMILTIMAIAWGTFAIATMLAIGEGLRITFADTLANTGHNLLMVQPGRTTKPYQGKHANIVVNLTNQDYNSIANLPNIAALSPMYTFTDSARNMRYKNKVLPETVLAVAANYNKIHEITIVPGGRFISPVDVAKRRFVIVLGTKTLEEFFVKGANPVGEVVYIGAQPFTVIGVMEPKSQLMGHGQSDAFVNWVPVSTYVMMVNPRFMDGIDLTYKDPTRLPQLQAHIIQVVAFNHGADPTDQNVVHFRDYSRRQERINNFFYGLQMFLGIVGALTLLVAGVGIANVMYASIKRATREIGVRMALGARTYQVIAHYIAEALLATLMGGGLGLAISWLVVVGLRSIPMHGRLIETIGQPRPVLSLMVVVVVVLVLGIVGLLAGLLPALKAAAVDPAEALSYE